MKVVWLRPLSGAGLGRRVERQWRTLFDHMELHQKQKLVSLWQCMEGDGPTLQLCFFVYYCKRNGCVGAEEKRREGGQRLFGRYDERVKTMIVACFFLPWYQHRPCFCQVSESTSPCQLYVTHVIYHAIPYVATYLPPTATLLP
ncbi:hypothetical protein VNO80_21128 [Phaseolus coccineus]|uniref:Uncharacterized protein n=1 Tax=Phaseolus coccineus TaxID=3886 RepID=A0AAN9M1V5_PHACN